MWRNHTVRSPFTENQYAVATNKHTNFESRHSPIKDGHEEIALASALANGMNLDETENICPDDIRYFQIQPYTDGESLGSLLDETLITDPSQMSLQVFKLSGSYCTIQFEKLWVLKNLKKFGRSPKIRLQEKNNPFETYGDLVVHFLRDSLELGINTRIGGSHWKNVDYLKKLPTLEAVKSPISDIYFTRSTICDSYANESIAKVLAHSYATMTTPDYPRVLKCEGKYYALDNEILWVLKGVRNMKSSPNLKVKVEVKIEMDQPLFQAFASDHIQKVTVRKTTFSHTNEESFIFECMKKMST